ncbi:MAG: hypothetical protein LUH22_01950 [Bacteroides sp.]|nr:hypothetical protein [Bacteroides sp.]
MHTTEPFSIPAIRRFVPEKLKPWILVIIVIIFQLSGGVYLAAVSEMVGSLALMREDIMMAGYASMVGMGLTFPILFRLKFCFSSKTSLLTCPLVLIVCNLVSMHIQSVPVLVTTCFVAGIFRMWGTFECCSTIQLWITPKRDLSVFFCFIYLLVQGCIQFSGLMTIYVAFFTKWEYVHWVVIALLGLVLLAIVVMFRTYRSMRKLPLFGIDWLGAILWGSIVLCIIFICNYGEYYDWFQSAYIRMATVAAGIMLVLNLWRASFIRHPFINLQTWCFKEVLTVVSLYILINIFLAPSHVLEHIYLESVLGYDELHTISLNWVVLAGIVVGAFFTYQTFALRKWRYKTMTVIGFLAIVFYLMLFYFTIDFNQSKESLVLPLFLRSFGYIIIGICFVTLLSRIPFQFFFQSLSIQAFVSAGIAGVLGTAILSHWLKILVKKNAMLLGASLDHVNTAANHLPGKTVYGALYQQSMMVSMKELYGYLLLLGIFCLFAFMVKESSIGPTSVIHPTYRRIRRWVKHELRKDRKMTEAT